MPNEPMTASEEALDVARKLTGAVTALSDDFRGLKASQKTLAEQQSALAKYGEQNRRFIRLTVVGLVLDITLSVLLAFGFVTVNDIAHSASKTAKSQKAACINNNEARAKQLGLWQHIIDISPPPKTPEQAAANKAFIDYVGNTFAPRDCTKL